MVENKTENKDFFEYNATEKEEEEAEAYFTEMAAKMPKRSQAEIDEELDEWI